MIKIEANRFPLPDGRDPGTGKVVFNFRRGTDSDNGATPWLTTIPLGKPHQPMKFTVDTGTTHSWVTSARCTTDACLMHRRFSQNDSESYKQLADPGNPTAIDFGAWGTMNAFLGRDFLSLTRALLPDKTPNIPQLMTLYLSSSYEGEQFENLVWDGALSLPRIKPDQCDSDQLLLVLKQSGLIDVELASFFYNGYTGKGQCLMGAVDAMRYDPSTLNFVPVTPLTEPGCECLWAITLDRLVCDDTPVFDSGIHFVLDTGSSLFKGDERYIEKIKCAVTENWSLPGVLTGTTPDFDRYPDLKFEINGSTYTVPPSQYFMETSPGHWELAFRPMSGLDGVLLVGSVFLETVYSIFYYNTGDTEYPQVVGLANPLF